MEVIKFCKMGDVLMALDESGRCVGALRMGVDDVNEFGRTLVRFVFNKLGTKWPHQVEFVTDPDQPVTVRESCE
jgi:hypothetical protein